MIINVINLSPDQPIDPYATPEMQQKIKRWREENVLSIAAQSKTQGFSVRFWPGNTDENVFRCGNISRAFKQIVRDAKKNDLPMICIGEDDLFFTAPGAWQYYLDNMPDYFDIYSAGIYNGTLQKNRIINGYSGNTLITVHSRFYDFFLSANEDPLKLGLGHLDQWLGNFCFEKKYIVCLPFIVKQTPNYSENHRRVLNYEEYEKSWQYYGVK